MNCLFENYENQPKNLSKIVNKYLPKYEQGFADYKTTKEFLKEVEKIGYTFKYGLDNTPFNLIKK
jgi:hypothetical protein